MHAPSSPLLCVLVAMSTLFNSAAKSEGHHYHAFCHPRKRPRAAAPTTVVQQQQQLHESLDALPEECLIEILRRLPGRRDRSVSACVSKRWLALLAETPPRTNASPSNEDDEEVAVEENTGCLTRCLTGREVTDVRLASLAVGTAGRGGLGKLLVRGTHPTRGATDAGFHALARGCPSLRVLSVWDVPSLGDDALAEIASSCPLLEKLDLQRCPSITDNGLAAVAARCPALTSLGIDSCFGVADDGLCALARLCPGLGSVSIRNCPLVGDRGVAGLMRSASSTLSKLKLDGLPRVTDMSLACVGYYGRAVTDLHLAGLESVAERGFWVMGNALRLRKLRSMAVVACRGATDLGLAAVAKGCPGLKQLCLRRCSYLSDVGLKAFAEGAEELENLQVEECHRITLVGVLASLLARKEKIKTLSVVKCFGVRDDDKCLPQQRPVPVCVSLRSLTIRDCPGLTGSGLAVVGKMCRNLVKLDLSGLVGITDAGLLPFVESSDAGMTKVSLRGCLNITDAAISALASIHGSTLLELHLGGCGKLTDRSLLAVADGCCKLVELDVTGSAVTDYGVALLASARQLTLQLLSLGGCAKLTRRSLPLLGNMGSTLVALNLLHCNSISNRGITSLEEKMWWCDILS
ncbi:EIN3-binding F-box protein 1-like [Iris pallida]|uniref:EIN3-binding F-box protein 1-like n=1 Tax=Iris pallida TaxID=29817 RepID=A0AAX6DN86_IRIPA|nr:EIN3-binding F-box protein 1-like [Iris pallida]